MELPRDLKVPLFLYEPGLPDVSCLSHDSPGAPGVQVLHRPVPDVPSPHATPDFFTARRRVPAVHGRERRHHLPVHRQELLLAAEPGHTEVHVVRRHLEPEKPANGYQYLALETQ